MNLPSPTERTGQRESLQEGANSEPGEGNAIGSHRAESGHSVGGAAMADEAGDEGVPSDGVSERHFVEQGEGGEEVAGYGVGGEEGGGGGGVVGEGGGFEHGSVEERGEGGGGGEEGEEGERVKEAASLGSFIEQVVGPRCGAAS